MAERAIVSSVDAIEAFRADIIVYLSKARPTIEEVTAEVMRTRIWLETDRRTYWENQVRLRTRKVEEAQQALLSARMSNLRQESSAEVAAVHRARRSLDDAQEKMRCLKKWKREFDGRVQPLVKQMEKLQTVLSHDLVHAVADLAQMLRTLGEYAGIAVPSATSPSEPPGTTTETLAGANLPSDVESKP